MFYSATVIVYSQLAVQHKHAGGNKTDEHDKVTTLDFLLVSMTFKLPLQSLALHRYVDLLLVRSTLVSQFEHNLRTES